MNENQYDDRETYNWINENVSGDNLIATTNAQRCAYYTDMKCVRLPYNIDESLLEVFILNNGVSILHIEENQIGRYYDYEWVASLFSGSESFNVGKIEFTLVEVYSRPHNQGEVWTYEIQ